MSELTDSQKIALILEQLVLQSSLLRSRTDWKASGPINANGNPLTAIADPESGVSGDLDVTPEGDLRLDPGGDVVVEKLSVPRLRFVEIVANATLTASYLPGIPGMIVPGAAADLVLTLDAESPDPEEGMYAYAQVANGRAADATFNPPDGGTINGNASAYTLPGFAAKTFIHHGGGAWQVI